ncbi:exopolyphosphatase [Dendrosporobacter sp. 1207_IL3150]|uniref:exopolyphosphatase n=1 Tax=Dendrosporobacter sp. 1207_IL3150 TaxID=3084054 RepID=UPI002FD8973A
MAEQKKYRLVTRSDFDGLVCAVLLREMNMLEDIKFVHPKDMQDGKVPVSENDITTNLPYVPGVYLAFDHHLSETIRVSDKYENHIIDANSPSAARVVYNYFGGKDRFPNVSEEMMAAVDQADSAQYSLDDILNPQGWALLNFLMDARTGLGRFRNFRISNYNLMMDLIDYCRTYSIDQILELPDVQERVELYRSHEEKFKEQIKRCARVIDNIIVLDLKDEEIIYPGNRFMIYALYPECNISIHVLWGLNKQNTVYTVGKSIINRSSNTNIGELMFKYGGGGHVNAGTCQIAHEDAHVVLDDLIKKITQDG